MTTFETTDEDRGEAPAGAVPGALRAAAVASFGAGAIHATAAGAHSEHRGVVIAFAITAALQIGWGAVALVRSGFPVSLLGAGINGGALVGWVLAKTTGIGFIDGLDTKEAVQFADGLAAGMAAVAVAGALLATAQRVPWVSRPRPALVGVAAVAVIGLAVPGMVSTGSHSHGDGDDHGHDGDAHLATAAGHDDHDDGHDDGHGDHASTPPKPYDATLPVDLGGTDGVTPEQQAEAEELVTETLEKLPQFADWTTLEERGWHSIGDGITGFEHYINWPLIEDDKLFDPDYPESLVFEVDGDEKTLVAAMYMTSRDVALDEVPDIGGDLIQWHIHDDLCYAGEENKWRVAGLAPPPEPCREGTFKFDPAPMIHVWITPHECGPFAALEGVAGGQVAEGEEVNCDHDHGAPA